MTVKQTKNKTHLVDDLACENYLINDIESKNEIFEHDNVESKEDDKKQQIKKEKNSKTKEKSPYNIFVTQTTLSLKKDKPNLTPKERKQEVSRLWKLEKEK